MPLWAQAGCWGLVGGAALVLGAAVALTARVPPRLIAMVMAFGSGVLISTLSSERMDEAYRVGGFDSTALGFLGGVRPVKARRLSAARGAPAQAGRHRRSLSELVTTLTLLKAIAALARIGERSSPNAGYSAPAAIGIPTTL
jgi:ZIP family zinc transporter